MAPGIFRYLRAAPLPNTGSVARDLLASERTFLAWARTGLGFIALGIALEKVEAFAVLSPALLQLQDSRTRLAAGILIASGSGCISHGTFRYFSTMSMLQQGKFRPNVPGVTLMATASLGIAMAGTLMVFHKNDRSGKSDVGA